MYMLFLYIPLPFFPSSLLLNIIIANYDYKKNKLYKMCTFQTPTWHPYFSFTTGRQAMGSGFMDDTCNF